MSKKIFVSIIINNYNYGRFLSKSIDSAIDQTVDKEIIVVDDGSTDNSQEIIRGYKNQVIPVIKENGGQASAFNAGFKISRGGIILFLDADDYLLPHALEEIVEAWEPSLAKVHYRLKVIDVNGHVLGIYPPSYTRLSGKDTLEILLRKSSYITSVTSGNAFNRLALEKVFPIPEIQFRIAADGYLNTLIPLYGQVKPIDKSLGVYRIHGENLWACTGNNSQLDRIYKMVIHDIKRYHFLIRESRKLGYHVNEKALLYDYRYVRLKLVHLRFNSDKYPTDVCSRLVLTFVGIKNLLDFPSETTLLGKIIISAKFILLGLLPLSIVKMLLNKL